MQGQYEEYLSRSFTHVSLSLIHALPNSMPFLLYCRHPADTVGLSTDSTSKQSVTDVSLQRLQD
jgi:hypothetical protein